MTIVIVMAYFLQIWARLTSKSDGGVSAVEGLSGLNVEADAGQAYLYSELYKTKKRYDTKPPATQTSQIFSIFILHGQIQIFWK